MEGILTLLVLLACPAMMLIMMRGMHGGHDRTTRHSESRDQQHEVDSDARWRR
jgi:hypothetical protein